MTDFQIVIGSSVDKISHLSKCKDTGGKNITGNESVFFWNDLIFMENPHLSDSLCHGQQKECQNGNIGTWEVRKIYPKQVIHIGRLQKREEKFMDSLYSSS